MAVLTAPGVYIDEIPSGVRTITGVPTSITAFLGRTTMGPVDTPTLVGNFGDFQRSFGGLAIDCPMTYAVSQFFQNGGSQALIVRAFNPTALTNGGVAQFTISGGGGGTLVLNASSPGAWANTISVEANAVGITQEIADRYKVTIADLFNLEITYGGTTEKIRNVTVIESSRRVDRVLTAESKLVVVKTLPGTTSGNDSAELRGRHERRRQRGRARSERQPVEQDGLVRARESGPVQPSRAFRPTIAVATCRWRSFRTRWPTASSAARSCSSIRAARGSWRAMRCPAWRRSG